MKKLMFCLMLLPSLTFAQNTTFCNPMGSMTSCLDQRGNLTTITPLGGGISMIVYFTNPPLRPTNERRPYGAAPATRPPQNTEAPWSSLLHKALS